jgi:hypothetical protein
MALRDGSWLVRLELDDGRTLEASTDDLTLAQLDVAERASGIPWPVMDPRRSIRVAMGLFTVLLIRDGEAEDKALQLVQELPASKLTGAFTFVPPEDPLPAIGEAAPDPA